MATTHVFDSSVQWQGDGEGWISAPGLSPMSVGLPPAFGGAGNQWTPESLLVASVEACTMLTFIAYAKRKGLEPIRYWSSASGILGRDESGKTRFLELTVRPMVEVANESEVSTAQNIFGAIDGKCFIGSSLKIDPKVEPTIVATSPFDDHPSSSTSG
jgi:organic hydroperoxide reductase OsmC/OhrA